MKEYEYSFKVNDLSKYIDYCINEGYEKQEDNNEIRDLYRSNNNVLARLTYINDDIILDFKEENIKTDILKERKESFPLKLKKENIDIINSILDILGYKQINHLERKRIVFVKNNVKFELDEYFKPEIMKVVGIEGNKEEVDKIYNFLNN